ncbi:MAG: hypothetical protein M1817_001662 [Caeruleum heppii]|nr:MAG: hypothetical protein M1817_001662 [Caeruleum heppii]
MAAGVLRLSLDRATYERAGLTGQPEGTATVRRQKTRWAVELNLRLPSMVHGKKGFERIVWAFKNVLTNPITWLFCDLNTSSSNAEPSSGPIEAHHPEEKTVTPQSIRLGPLPVPSFDHLGLRHDAVTGDIDTEAYEEQTADLLEWTSLVALGSPRVRSDDSIDSFLCRYKIPDQHLDGRSALDDKSITMVRTRWQGLIPIKCITRLFLACLNTIRASHPHSFFWMSVYAFDTGLANGINSYTMIRMPPEKPLDIDISAQKENNNKNKEQNNDDLEQSMDLDTAEGLRLPDRYLLFELSTT